ncbi:MAG: DNA topoisomerase I [Candidatus Methanomethylophilaceae archaeon]|nr:DNA topoisomerase I [Candidatus Methanomethylophilaceae archaeon]
MKRLVITEKSNAARRISTILSDDGYKTEKTGSTPVLRFQSGGDDYAVIGLRGHIIELDYPEAFNDWRGVPPEDLVFAPQEKVVKAKGILETIREEMQDADEIIIATDYDREGELIGLETVRLAGVPREKTRRARFSALTKSEVEGAFQNLSNPDERLADAAEARQVIDLAWGAVLTRMVSLSSGQLGRNFLSVGRVQSPTLKLLVDRHEEIESFVPQSYWEIGALFGEEEFPGDHVQNPFWSKEEADAVSAKVLDADMATVLRYTVEEKEEFRPAPFDTTQMQVEANRIGIPPSAAMKLAEDLYTAGFISYPRTENTVYPRSLSLHNILERLKESDFAREAEEILAQEKISPSRGKRSTTDHPPIHPTSAASSAKLKGDKWKLYELIVRRFLATLAPPAVAKHTECELDVRGESFLAKGYQVIVPGWRKYYPYSKVNESSLPLLTEGSQVEVRSIKQSELQTKPPYRYNQGYLIQEMDRLGLGTKSTRHDIIGKLYSRNYVQGNNLVPTPSGIALTSALSKYGGTITETSMTSTLEEDMGKIALGERTLEAVVKESQEMLEAVSKAMRQHDGQIGDEIRTALKEQQHIGTCAACGEELVIKKSWRGSSFIACTGYPECRKAYPMPRSAMVQVIDSTCPACNNPQLRVIRRGQPPQEVCVDPDCPTNVARNNLGPCPSCKEGEIRILFSKAGKRFAGCTKWPDCDRTYPLPPRGHLEAAAEPCPECGSPVVALAKGPQCINPECPTRPKKATKSNAATVGGKAAKTTATKSKAKPKASSAGEKTGTSTAAKATKRKAAAKKKVKKEE